jgi:hypothetical protein
MMHQSVDSHGTSDGYPVRETIIEKDEIISLKIDLEVLTPAELDEKYFCVDA